MTALRPERGGNPWEEEEEGEVQQGVYLRRFDEDLEPAPGDDVPPPVPESSDTLTLRVPASALQRPVETPTPDPGDDDVPPLVPESSDTLTLRVLPSAFQRPVETPEPAPRADVPELVPELVPESSDTLTLRVLPSAFQRPVESPTEPPAEVGGRAERRRAEQQQARRHRGGRAAGPRSQAAQPKPVRPKESLGIIAVRVLGELFITLGVIMFLFVAYQLWWTNVAADAYASGSAKSLEKQWDPTGGAGTGTPSKDHPAYPSSISQDTKFAIIYIPKLDVMTPIAEGVDKSAILDKGLVGHYTGDQETAFPWEATGNFALAGHRNTHGEPFRYINKLVPGDKIVVETAYDYYTYTVTSSLAQTSPTDVSVIAPVPPESGFKQPGRYITLTTCTPEFTSKYRMAVWGKLTQDLPKSSGKKPQALQTG